MASLGNLADLKSFKNVLKISIKVSNSLHDQSWLFSMIVYFNMWSEIEFTFSNENKFEIISEILTVRIFLNFFSNLN